MSRLAATLSPASRGRAIVFVLLGLCLLQTNLHAADKPITLKLGTLAPANTSYHKSLQAMGESWRKATDGAVKLIIYPNGTLGGESDMVQLMQTHSLDAGLLTSVGLSDIDSDVYALQSMPMAFRTLDEVDYVGEHLRSQLEKLMLAKGYMVLFWSDSGWVRIFTRTPILHPDDLRKLKVFSWAGNAHEIDLWKSAGFTPVALETAGIPTGLMSKTIDAVPMPPFFALAGQLDMQAKYMLELNWGSLVGALVIRKDAWDRVPASAREAMLKIAAETGKQVKAAGRAESDAAVAAMVKRGLIVQKVTPEVAEEWHAMIEKIQDQIRGKIVPAEMFDESQRLIKEYRASHGASTP